MRNIYAYLLIIARNNINVSNPSVLYPFPKIELTQTTEPLEFLLKKILKESTQLEMFDKTNYSGWILLEQGNIFNKNSDIWIPFVGYIPEKIEVQKGYEWKEFLSVFKNELDKNLLLGAKI